MVCMQSILYTIWLRLSWNKMVFAITLCGKAPSHSTITGLYADYQRVKKINQLSFENKILPGIWRRYCISLFPICVLFFLFCFVFFCLMHSHPHHLLRNSGEGCPTSHTWAQAWDIALLTEEILWIHSPICLVKSETCGKPAGSPYHGTPVLVPQLTRSPEQHKVIQGNPGSLRCQTIIFCLKTNSPPYLLFFRFVVSTSSKDLRDHSSLLPNLEIYAEHLLMLCGFNCVNVCTSIQDYIHEYFWVVKKCYYLL